MKNVLIFILLAFFAMGESYAGNPAVIYGSGGKASILPANGLEFKGKETLSGSEVLGMKNTASTGNLSGGIVSIGAPNTTVNITAGVGYILDNTSSPSAPVMTRVEYGPFTNEPITTLAGGPLTILYIDSAGSLVQENAVPTPERLRDVIILGALSHPDLATIVGVIESKVPMANAALSIKDLSDALGVINTAGNNFSAGGADLTIQKNAGSTYEFGSNSDSQPKNPSVKAHMAQTPVAQFNYWYSDGAGGHIPVLSTDIDPDSFDDGSGTLATVSNNKFTIHRIFFRPSVSAIDVVYGFDEYSTLAGAEAALQGEITDISFLVSAGSAFRSWLIVKKGSSDLTASVLAGDAKFIEAGKFGETIGSGSSSATTTLQVAYDNSTQPQIVLDAIRLGVQIRDAATTIGASLFEILSNNGVVNYFKVAIDGITLENGVAVNGILDEDNLVSDSATSLATQQSIKAYADSILPDQTGNSQKVLSTSGITPSWRIPERLNAQIKDNLLENPSFEANGDTERVITVGSGISFSGQSVRTVQASTHNVNKFQLSSSAASTLSYVIDKVSNFEGRQMSAFCEIKTSRTDVKFKSRVNGATVSELTVESDNKWRYYKLPFVGGATSNGYEIIGDTSDVNGFEFDNCYLGNAENLIQEIGTAHFVGSLNYNSTNCIWNSTATSFQDFPVDSDCIAQNVVGDVAAPDTKLPAIKIPNARTDGYYKVVFSGIFGSQTGSNSANFALSSTNGQDTTQAVTYVLANQTGYQNSLFGNFRFSAVGDETIRVIAKVPVGGHNILARSENEIAKFTVHFYPDSASTVVTESTTLEVPIKWADQDFTPLFNGAGMNVQKAVFSRDGEYMTVKINAITTAVTSVAALQMPTGYLIDVVKAPNKTVAGKLTRGTVGGHDVFNVLNLYSNASFVYISFQHGTTNDSFLEANWGSVMGNGETFYVEYKVPIVGWTATEKKTATIHGTFEQIKDSDLLFIKAEGAIAGGLAIHTPVNFKEITDNKNAFNGTTVTIPTDGVYSFDVGIRASTGAINLISIYVNNSRKHYISDETSLNDRSQASVTLPLNAGDIVDFRVDNAITQVDAPIGHYLSVTEQPDTKAIVENLMTDKLDEIAGIVNETRISDTLYHLEYNVTTAQSIPNGVAATLIYNNMLEDNTNGQYNSSTGIFTSDKISNYMVCATAMFDNNLWTATNTVEFKVNGFVLDRPQLEGTQTIHKFVKGCKTLKLEVGETATITIYQGRGAATPIHVSSSFTHLSITEIPDTAQVVRNLLGEASQTTCETKTLSADTSSVGTYVTDLGYTNLVIGGRYSLKGTAFYQSGGQLRIYNATTQTNEVARTYMANSDTITAFNSPFFVATDTNISTLFASGTTLSGDGTLSESWIQLCKLPDTVTLQ